LLKLDEHHDLSLPNSVVEMFSGVLGVPPAAGPRSCKNLSYAAQLRCAVFRAKVYPQPNWTMNNKRSRRKLAM